MKIGEKFNHLQNLFVRTLKEHELPPLSFKLGRTKKDLCRFVYHKYRYAVHIEVSKYFLEKCPIEMLEDTVLHEIAHYMDFLNRGYSNHDYNWKYCCIKVGANPNRVCEVPTEYLPQSKWSMVCNSCDNEIRYHRKPKKDKSCGKCCPTWNPQYKLKLIQNY